MSIKVVEQYIQTLKEYTAKLNKEKVTLLMQVGEFFEIYGLIYPDGTRVGNVWEFCDNVNLKVALKPQVVYDDPTIQVYMGGVGESYINPYIQKAVDRYGWTIIIFEQIRIGNSNKFERKEASIISPGININSDNFSNIAMVIYMEQIKQYIKLTPNKDKFQINIGVAFVDCLTGDNGIMTLNNMQSSDISIPLDEILKLLTIKNPKELYIYLENIDITDDDFITALHLFNYNFKIIRNHPLDNCLKLQYQKIIFEQTYINHLGLLDITQQLGIDSIEHTYSRIALTLLIEFIMKHDKTIIHKLTLPEIIFNSDKYLMLANNSLEQLDILTNTTSSYGNSNRYNKRFTLLELLDNTQTPMGKLLLRQQLSIPITDEATLEQRYTHIEELIQIHTQYLTTMMVTDKYGSPLFQLRKKLSTIKNIENYLRKIITAKINPFEITNYITSLNNCKLVYEYINTFQTDSNIRKYILPCIEQYKTFCNILDKLNKDIQLANLNCNVWNSVENNPFMKNVNKILDELQDEIDSDRNFLDLLIIALSKIIDSKYTPPATSTTKQLIFVGENANKGIHIFTNTTRKDILETYFVKNTIKVGKYTITNKDIKFLKMKESKWEIEIPFLKTSNGTLKANIDRIGKLAKQEMLEWMKINIIDNTPILDTLTTFAHFIATCDVLQSNVLNAIEKGYTKPSINKNASRSCMNVEKIRHPIIEHINTSTKYIPNDITLGTNTIDGILLFGVNAVGKSSLMKSIGINIIMAQAGMYVACSKMTYKPYKYLFTRIRNNDNLYAGLSSFEVEMKEFKVILKYADENSIILGDELAAGTNTEDATAIVASGVIELSQRKSNFLFATHLHFLANMQCIKTLSNIRMCHLLVEFDPLNPKKLIYNRKLLEGNGPKSYGILVCDAMNMDNNFLNRAKEIRQTLDITNINSSTSTSNSNAVGWSKYNKDKIIIKCEICSEISNNDACDVHHINQQCDANTCDLIDDNTFGIFNKNKLWNLVSLCKTCHQAIHSSPPRIQINGYNKTSNGIELDYKYLDTNLDLGNDKKCIDESITDEIQKLILDMKKNNYTPKKIQFNLKRNHNITVSQQTIRNM